jgi:hypothetical protein
MAQISVSVQHFRKSKSNNLNHYRAPHSMNTILSICGDVKVPPGVFWVSSISVYIDCSAKRWAGRARRNKLIVTPYYRTVSDSLCPSTKSSKPCNPMELIPFVRWDFGKNNLTSLISLLKPVSQIHVVSKPANKQHTLDDVVDEYHILRLDIYILRHQCILIDRPHFQLSSE